MRQRLGGTDFVDWYSAPSATNPSGFADWAEPAVGWDARGEVTLRLLSSWGTQLLKDPTHPEEAVSVAFSVTEAWLKGMETRGWLFALNRSSPSGKKKTA